MTTPDPAAPVASPDACYVCEGSGRGRGLFADANCKACAGTGRVTPGARWLTMWAELSGRIFISVTEEPEFCGGLNWPKAGSWRYEPGESGVRPRLGRHEQRGSHVTP